jgi:hypothetical protein
MVTVPVTPLGTGLTVGEAPSCRPFAPTGAPGTVPSDEVTPSDGVTVPTWANAGLQDKKSPAVAMINNGLMEDSPITGRVALRAYAGTAVGSAAEAMAFIFMIADRG